MHRFRFIPGSVKCHPRICSPLNDSVRGCEGPDQTVWMRRLIWAFAFRIYPKAHFRLARSTYTCYRDGLYRHPFTRGNKGSSNITKTCLYNFDTLKPHFYIVKLGFTGVNIIFLISAQNIDCGYSLEPPRRGGSNEYPQSIF